MPRRRPGNGASDLGAASRRDRGRALRRGPRGIVRGAREDSPAAEPPRRVGANRPAVRRPLESRRRGRSPGCRHPRADRRRRRRRRVSVNRAVRGGRGGQAGHLRGLGRGVRAFPQRFDPLRPGAAGVRPSRDVCRRAQPRCSREDLPPAGVACTAWYEEALGPVDGQATDRVTRAPADDRRRIESRHRDAASSSCDELATRWRCSPAHWSRRPCGRLRFRSRTLPESLDELASRRRRRRARNDGWRSRTLRRRSH